MVSVSIVQKLMIELDAKINLSHQGTLQGGTWMTSSEQRDLEYMLSSRTGSMELLAFEAQLIAQRYIRWLESLQSIQRRDEAIVKLIFYFKKRILSRL